MPMSSNGLWEIEYSIVGTRLQRQSIIIEMQYLNDAKIVKCLVLIIFIATSIPIISIVKLLTTSYIAAVIVYLGFLFWILRYAGRFALFPGSTQYVQSDLENKMSVEIIKTTFQIFGHLEFVIQKIVQKQPFLTDVEIGMVIEKNVQGMLEILCMFQSTLSHRKSQLLQLYKKLHHQLSFEMAQEATESKEIDKLNFIIVANRPKFLKTLSQGQFSFIANRCENIRRVANQILESLRFFEGRKKSLLSYQGLKHFCNEESLYEIRFGFYNWKNVYDYEINLITTDDKQTIETVIIHREKGYEEAFESPSKTKNRLQKQQYKPAVLFCNPNGVFIQFFGIGNSYIRNYLQNGFKVILWNYRGYGQSTSTPTLSKTQKDAIDVYSFYSAKYAVPVVHGYSIGGHSSVAVAKRFSEDVRVLIADRTFASMESMSRVYGKIVSILTKIVFFTDNYCLAQQFQECRNQSKILICDQLDEVINETCSLKRAIMQNITRKGGSSKSLDFSSNSSCKAHKNSLDQENQLQDLEDVRKYPKCQESTHPNSQTFKKQISLQGKISISAVLVEKLVISLQRIFSMTFSQPKSDMQDYTGREQLPENQVGSMDSQMEKQVNLKAGNDKSKKRIREQFVESLLEILGEVDGGGVVLFDKLQLEHTFRHSKRTELKDICRGYLLGLAYYGSCRPVRSHRNAYNPQNIKRITIEKLQRAFKEIGKLVDPRVESNMQIQRETSEEDSTSNDPDSRQYIQAAKSLIEVLKETKKILVRSFENEAFNKSIGVLIPTSNGHNYDLNNVEFDIIIGLVEKVSGKSEAKEQLREEIMN